MSDERTSLSGSGTTVASDEFEVDLWDTSVGDESRDKTYHFECLLVACDSLENEDYCLPSDQCTDRYSNLQGYEFSRRKRRQAEIPDATGKTVSAELVISRKTAESEFIVESGPTSGGVMTQVEHVLKFNAIFVFYYIFA